MPSIIIQPPISSLISPLPIPGEPLRRSGGGSGGGGGGGTTVPRTEFSWIDMYQMQVRHDPTTPQVFKSGALNGLENSNMTSAEQLPADAEGAGIDFQYNAIVGNDRTLVSLHDAPFGASTYDTGNAYTVTGATQRWAFECASNSVTAYYNGVSQGSFTTIAYPSMVLSLEISGGAIHILEDGVSRFEFGVAPSGSPLRATVKMRQSGSYNEGIPSPRGEGWYLGAPWYQPGDEFVTLSVPYYNSSAYNGETGRATSLMTEANQNAHLHSSVTFADGSFSFTLPHTAAGIEGSRIGIALAPSGQVPTSPEHATLNYSRNPGHFVATYTSSTNMSTYVGIKDAGRLILNENLLAKQAHRIDILKDGTVATLWSDGNLIYTWPDVISGPVVVWAVICNGTSTASLRPQQQSLWNIAYNPNPAHLV